MNIRIPIVQVPVMWEHIKFVATTTDNVDCGDMQAYCNNLLIKLLTNQVQAIVRLNTNREIDAMMIVDYSVSEVTGIKTQHFRNFYSWKENTVEEWEEAFVTVKKFAREEGCGVIEATSYNPKVWQLAEDTGFKETSRQYLLPL